MPTSRTALPTPLTVLPATPTDYPLLERLWLIFRHDLSHTTGALPNADGTYRSEWLESAFTDDDWAAWVMRADDHPVGFAIVRSLNSEPHVLNSFFIVAPARRHGCGRTLFESVVSTRPGRWAVAFQDANAGAARFWRQTVAAIDPNWRHEHRAIPDKPEVPSDSWINFLVHG